MGSTKVRTTDLETVLGCGGYQVFIFVLYQLSVFLQCSNMAFMSFGKVAPSRWWCVEEDGNSTSTTSENGTGKWNQTEQCLLYASGACKRYQWETDFRSIVPEWQLICDRTGIVYLIMSVQMLGVLIGSPLFGQLSDTWGRKWTLFFAQMTLVLLDALSILSPNWQAFLGFRFFIGLSCGGTITICYVYLTEVLKARHRLWVTTIGGWPPAFAVFAALALATKDWKRLSLAIGALGIVPSMMLPFAAESPRWQLQKQKLDEAQRSVERVMKWNREPEGVRARLAHVIGSHQQHSHPLRPDQKKKGQSYSFWHLFRTRKMAVHTAVLNFGFLSISMITYGIILNNDKLTGDIYKNFFFFACIRWISSALNPLVDMFLKPCGRKMTSSICFAITCLAAIAISFILIFTSPEDKVAGHAVTGLVLVASMLASPIWASLNLTSVEAFPTPIRNIAVGLSGMFTRLGGVIVPVFLYMADLWKPSPYVLFAVVALISAILCGFLLPETKGKALPDKMPPRQERWWLCCCSDDERQKPQGTIRSDSFTVYQFSNAKADSA